MKRERKNIPALCAAIISFVIITAGISGCSEKDRSAEDKPEVTNGEKTGSKELNVTVYAYCPCERCNTKKWAGKLTSGRRMKTLLGEGKNICAADPGVIPLGSTVTYDGRDYVVADVGGRIKGNTINILLKNHNEVNKFGVKKDQTITITEP